MFNILFHELNGINLIFLFSNTILTEVLNPDGKLTPREGVYLINIMNTVASFFSIWTIRTFGRRPLLLVGEVGISISHCLIATFILIKFDVGVIVMMGVFMAIYQNTCGPVPWCYAAETLPDVALGVAYNVLFGTILVISLTTEPLMETGLHAAGVFYLFGLFSAIAFFFVYCFIRETKGLTEKEKKLVYSSTNAY
jgi:SP family sugar porter-like MFS transporter